MRLAEPEGYVQVFVDAAAPPAGLLQSLASRNRTWPSSGTWPPSPDRPADRPPRAEPGPVPPTIGSWTR